MIKISLILVLIITGGAIAVPAANPLIYAPEIPGIVVDGDLSDWAEASSWAVFGAWDGNPPGLDSTTQAQYAWNDANDLLYIGIESTEGVGLILEVGGLMGVIGEPNAAVLVATPFSKEATQMRFTNWVPGNPPDIENQTGGITDGVAAALTFETVPVVTITIEIALPIYSDWSDNGTAMDLQNRMDVYVFANAFDSNEDFGDSQVADGAYVRLWDGVVIELASLVRLLETSSPQVCADIPGPFKPEFDLDGNCYVDVPDLSMVARDWLSCNDPCDSGCTPNW